MARSGLDRGERGLYEGDDLLRPHFADRRWLNYFSDDDGSDAIGAAYGANNDRLVEVKRRHDPENVFHLNRNIDPRGAGGAEPS